LGGDVVINDTVYVADGAHAAFYWTDWFWTVVLVGLVGCFALINPRLKTEKSGPTDDPPRVLSAKEIEDLEDQGKIW
jgi:hypothetical protein